jgi:hypothetical protein
VPARSQCTQRDLLRHGAARQQQRLLLPELLGDAPLEPLDRAAFPVDVAALVACAFGQLVQDLTPVTRRRP